MKAHRLFLFLCLLMAVTGPAYGQAYDPSPSAQTGRPRFSSQVGGGIDSINVFNGNLSVDIPIFALPGRELSTGLHVSYNSQKWEYVYAVSQQVYSYTGGWRGFDLIPDTPIFWPEYLGCEAGNPYQDVWILHAGWRDGIGTKHQFQSEVDVPVQQCNTSGGPNSDEPSVNTRLFQETTGSGGRLLTGNTRTEDVLGFGDGRVIEFTASPAIRAANGNFLIRNAYGLPVQDTLERVIQYETNGPAASFYRKYTIKDTSGNPQTYTLNFENGHTVCNPWTQQGQVVDGRLMSIVLPDNRTYSFEYTVDGGHGYLTKMTLPAGGWIGYTYPDTACTNWGDAPVVTRSVSYDGSTVGSTSTYTRGGNIDARDVTITSVEGGTELHREVHRFDLKGRDYETTVQKPDQTVMETVARTWTDSDPGPTFITTTRNGLHQKRALGYDGWGHIVLQEDTDWYASGSGTAISRVIHSWDSVGGPYYVGPGPLALLWKTEVLGINPANGQLGLQGKTEYLYDEYTFDGQTHTSVPNHNGNTERTGRGNLTTVRAYKDASNYIETHFKYDNLGNLVQTIDPLGRVTTTDFTDNFIGASSHNSFAYPTQATIQNQVTHTAYNYDTGLVKQATDPRGQNTTMAYDTLGRLLTVAEPNGRVTSTSYDDSTPKVHAEVQVESGKWRKAETIFDKMGRALKDVQFDPAGNVYVDTEYDGNGRVKRVSQPYRSGETVVWTTTAYDALDRPVTVSNPDGSQASIAYGAIGALQTVTATDEAGNPRRTSYNGIGQMVKVEEANPDLSTPLVTQYSYYISGALAKVFQGSQTRTFTLDWLGRMSSETHPESGTTAYEYYADGALYTRTDARGAGYKATYTYDSIGRLKTLGYADGTPGVTYNYDANGYTGLLTSVVTSGVTSSTFSYNSAGLQTAEQTAFNGVSGSFTTGYGYDLDGRLTSIQYPSGRTVTRTYQSSGDTAADRLLSMTDDKTSAVLLSSVSDNAAGQIVAKTLGGAIAEGHSFNSRNQLTGITSSVGGTMVMDLGYGYGSGNNGRIRSRTDGKQPEHSIGSYSYDAMNRLTGVVGAGWGVSWVLDGYGNRTTQTPSGLASGRVGSQSFGYAGNNNRNGSFSYDAAGNVTNDGHSYDYDAESRIRSIDGGTVQFAYDSEGRRIAKTIGSTTTVYIYGLTGLLSEFTTTNSGTLPPASTDRLEYRVGEQTGTAVLLLNSSGTVMENNRVFPFGEPWQVPAATTSDQTFTTYDRDATSDLDYAMARHYASRSGRFMSPDPGHAGASPSDPQNWNAYAYAGNDPINFIDPSGYCTMRNGVAVEDGGPPCPPPPSTTVNVTMPRPTPGSPLGLGPCLDPELAHDCIPAGLPLYGGPSLSDIVDRIGSGIQRVVNALPSIPPPDPRCMATAIGSGMIVGGGLGTIAGASGFALGPVGVLTMPSGAILGAASGGAIGGTVGLVTCSFMASAGSSGGGGKTGRKVNADRVASAQQKTDELRKQIGELEKQPNKTPAIKQVIENLKSQLRRELDRMKLSEEHARRGQR